MLNSRRGRQVSIPSMCRADSRYSVAELSCCPLPNHEYLLCSDKGAVRFQTNLLAAQTIHALLKLPRCQVAHLNEIASFVKQANIDPALSHVSLPLM